MTREHFEQIKKVLEDEGVDYDVRDDYSGRGMGGKICPAFVVDSRDIIVWACGRIGLWIDDAGLRWDNMGRDQVVVY